MAITYATILLSVERGVFKWGVFHARKPVRMDLVVKPPVPFVKTNHLIIDAKDEIDEVKKAESNVVIVDILKRMSKETIDALPSTVELLITMSAGLDHIDLDACKANGEFDRKACLCPSMRSSLMPRSFSQSSSSRTREGMPSRVTSCNIASASS